MSNAVATREPKVAADAADELAVFRKQDAIVAELREKYMGLTIKGVNDRKGFDAVHEGRMVVKRARIDVEKTRTTLKADILERGRKIDAEAKRVAGLLAPIEDHLESQETAITNERERIKREAEEARKAKVKQRFEALQLCGYQGDMMAVPELGEIEFGVLLATAQAAKAEADRLAEEARQQQAAEVERLRKLEAEAAAERARQEAAAAEQRKAEEARLAAERAELDRVRKEQEAEAARLRAEQERIEAEKNAAARAAELERARLEAAERARIETEQRLAREQAEAKAAAEREALRIAEKAKADEVARLKAEAMKPQREKLLAVASALLVLVVPDGPGSKAVSKAIERCMNEIQEIANGPLE
jgi:hypothetical protein